MLAYLNYGYGYGYGYGGFYFDWTYLLVIVGIIICAIASARVRSTFNRYSNVRSMSGMTGALAAEKILQDAGIYDVQVARVSGNLTDHYNPATKILNLSDSVYGSASVAAIGVAAHECGHAIQHHKGYAPLRVRTALVPIANFGSSLAWPLILVGLLLSGPVLIKIGIIFFSFAVLFQIVTLPVEFNASHRAVKILGERGMLRSEELRDTKIVLRAAALTYVAGALSGILQLLRLLVIANGRNRR